MIFNTRPWLIDTPENKREIQRFETVQKVNKIIFASKCELKFRWLIEILADHEWYIPADVSLYSDPYDEFSSLTRLTFFPRTHPICSWSERESVSLEKNPLHRKCKCFF